MKVFKRIANLILAISLLSSLIMPNRVMADDMDNSFNLVEGGRLDYYDDIENTSSEEVVVTYTLPKFLDYANIIRESMQVNVVKGGLLTYDNDNISISRGDATSKDLKLVFKKIPAGATLHFRVWMNVIADATFESTPEVSIEDGQGANNPISMPKKTFNVVKERGSVTETFVDEQGNKIAPDNTAYGEVGEGYYDFNGNLKHIIPGYYESVKQNATMIAFNQNTNTVLKIVFKKIPTVIIKYKDEEGNELHPSQTVSGDSYDDKNSAYKLDILGYSFYTTDIINHEDKEQVITHVYKREAGDTKIKYVDDQGKDIATEQTISGNVGDDYDATTATYKLAITGYTLDTTKLPSNAIGKISKPEQTVTYVYKKVAGNVTVKYTDDQGKDISTEQTISGNVGDNYDATTATYKLAITGYTLDTTKLPSNATGKLGDNEQTVTYVYKKVAGNVTVKYTDDQGKDIATEQTISGNVGDNYDATAITYKLAITGYTLDANKLPINATGRLGNNEQTVTYVYKKVAGNVTVKYTDDQGKDIATEQTIS